LAQQLSDAATRAAARDTKLTRNELAELAKITMEKLGGQSYQWNRERHDAEVPRTDTPELLARAKRATDFLHSEGPNPFAGMSRDQLALITYDEGGSFTVNERFAAWSESSKQESAWRKQLVEKSMDVYHRTGNLFAEGIGKEMLEHHRSLPLIEQSLVPASYEAELQAKIATSGQDTRQTMKMEPMSLLYLLNKWAKEREEHGLPSLDGAGDDSPESNIATAALSGTPPESSPDDMVAPAAPQIEISTAGKATTDSYNVMLKRVFGVSDP
jgi:hypothetical protein